MLVWYTVLGKYCFKLQNTAQLVSLLHFTTFFFDFEFLVHVNGVSMKVISLYRSNIFYSLIIQELQLSLYIRLKSKHFKAFNALQVKISL